jgi:transketolase
MKRQFIDALVTAAREDERIWLLAGDVGYGLVDDFQRAFPSRFLNAGIAEQNMIGMAAGLAREGCRVFVYSIANFLLLRALEQVRNDVAAPKADVKLVGAGAGFTYGSLGYTHHALEDIGIARLLPNMRILSPSDADDVTWAVKSMASEPGPCYLRLGSLDDAGDMPRVVDHQQPWVAILFSGDVKAMALRTAMLLYEAGIPTRTQKFVQVWPIDKRALLNAVKGANVVATIETHLPDGGLGGITAEMIAAVSTRPIILRFGLRPVIGRHGSRSYLMGDADLTPDRIAKIIRSTVTDAREASPV